MSDLDSNSDLAARIKAEAANRAKDELLAIVSHELRTSIQPILGWIALLQSGEADPVIMAKALDRIERSTRVHAQVIEDITDISRSVLGKLDLHFSEVDLVEIIREAMETVRFTAEAKGIRIEAEQAENAWVHGDPARLRQVIWNLLSNALKFTPSGGRIDIRYKLLADSVDVVITDTGVGIPLEAFPQIFDRFARPDPSVSRLEGLGVGLWLVRHLVEMHGGTVVVESPGYGGGATFFVSLPRKVPGLKTGSRSQSPLLRGGED